MIITSNFLSNRQPLNIFCEIFGWTLHWVGFAVKEITVILLLQSTKDQMALDISIPLLYGAMLALGFQLLGILYVTIHITWQIVFIIGPLSVVFLHYQGISLLYPNIAFKPFLTLGRLWSETAVIWKWYLLSLQIKWMTWLLGIILSSEQRFFIGTSHELRRLESISEARSHHSSLLQDSCWTCNDSSLWSIGKVHWGFVMKSGSRMGGIHFVCLLNASLNLEGSYLWKFIAWKKQTLGRWKKLL